MTWRHATNLNSSRRRRRLRHRSRQRAGMPVDRTPAARAARGFAPRVRTRSTPDRTGAAHRGPNVRILRIGAPGTARRRLELFTLVLLIRPSDVDAGGPDRASRTRRGGAGRGPGSSPRHVRDRRGPRRGANSGKKRGRAAEVRPFGSCPDKRSPLPRSLPSRGEKGGKRRVLRCPTLHWKSARNRRSVENFNENSCERSTRVAALVQGGRPCTIRRVASGRSAAW